MYGIGSPGDHDNNYALFEAQMLAGPPKYDPAEEHMQWLMSTTGTWIAVVAVIAGAALWVWDYVVASAVTAVLTLGALALARMVARRQRARSSVG